MWSGINIEASNIVIENNVFKTDVNIWFSEDIILRDSIISTISIEQSMNILIENVTNFDYFEDYGSYYRRIRIIYSSNITITDAKLNHCDNGFNIEHSSNITIENSIITANRYGIWMYYSHNITIINNVFENGGIFVRYSDNNTVVNNLVNDKPLIYLEDIANITITGDDIGQILLVNSKNITVTDVKITDTTTGIELSSSSNIMIINSELNNNFYGACVLESSNITISNTIADSNEYGLYISNSINLTVKSSELNYNSRGIYIINSNYNRIVGNNFTGCGLFLSNSYDGTLGF